MNPALNVSDSDMSDFDQDSSMDQSFTSSSDDYTDKDDDDASDTDDEELEDKSTQEGDGEEDYGPHLLNQLRQMNRKFRLACRQVVLMNNEIEYLQTRYDLAVASGSKSFRYFLRLKMATMEGARNMFYEYASRHADNLDSLHVRMLREGLIEQELDLAAMDQEMEA